MALTPLESNEADIIDMQDKLGYVDTGPIQQTQTRAVSGNQPPYTPATSSTSHIIIKEPIPQRQVQFPMDAAKKRSSATAATSTRPEMTQDSYRGATQPTQTVRKSNSIDATTSNIASIPYSLNVPQQILQQRPSFNSRSNSFSNSNKGKGKQHFATEIPSLTLPTTTLSPSSSSSSSSSAEMSSKYTNNNNNNASIGIQGPPQTTQQREEIKELFVSKFLELKELADMLQLIDEPIPQQQPTYNQRRSFEHTPKPTPSKSDPNHYPPLRRVSSKGKLNNNSMYAYPSPENNRRIYNKSADATANYQEPNNRHSTSNRSIYSNNNNNRDYLVDHHNSRTPHDGNGYYNHRHAPLPPQQAAYYPNLYDDNRDYYLPNEDPFLDLEEYYMAPPPPPPLQRMQPRYYDDRQRRKSFSNLHEEQYRLNRKGSRANMRRLTPRQQPQQFYEYSDIPFPPLHHHHHHQFPYGAAPYYQNQQYSPNGGGGKGNGGGGGGGAGGDSGSSIYFS